MQAFVNISIHGRGDIFDIVAAFFNLFDNLRIPHQAVCFDRADKAFWIFYWRAMGRIKDFVIA